ncbi:hypothetical protein Q9L58_001944 [Maublancomyces gigas]|uniref:Uncharacterized protein n=1 Tax=Discina gigas TaxID=1032678 RepID=A0ABR3GT24_9PEZI
MGVIGTQAVGTLHMAADAEVDGIVEMPLRNGGNSKTNERRALVASFYAAKYGWSWILEILRQHERSKGKGPPEHNGGELDSRLFKPVGAGETYGFQIEKR